MNEGFARQAVVLAGALALWSLAPEPALWALVLAYVAACALFSALDAGSFLREQSRGVRALLALFALAPGAATLVRVWPALVEREGLSGLFASFGDRLRLERVPSIAPALLSADEPQTFFVNAPGARRVAVKLAPGVASRAAEALGEGLFRVDYDSRRDGTPKPADGEVEAEIALDGDSYARTMVAVTPLPHPRWLCLSPGAALAATVSRETDELIVVSARGLERRIAVGDAPSDCAFVDDTRIAVSHEVSPALWLVDAAGGETLGKIPIGPRQVRLARSPEGAELAVARAGRAPEVVLVDLRASVPSARFALSAAPDWIAFGPDAGTLLVATRADARLHRFARDGTSFRETGSLVLGRPVVTLGRAEGGARVLLAVTDFRADGRAHLGNHFVQDQLVEVDVASMRVTASLLTARRTPRQSRAGDVDSGLSPMGVSPARGAGGTLVAFAGSDELWRLDGFDREPERIDLVPLGVFAPHGVGELADGTLVATSPSQGLIALLPKGGTPASVLRLAPDDAHLRADDPPALARRLGERGFYEGTRSGISCQSCHLHADTDLSLHNLGDRALLPTLSVRGLFATAPYLRDGSYPHLRDLDYVAEVLYRGYLRRAPGRAQTLEAYVASLPRTPSAVEPSGRDPAAERRGLAIFVRSGCRGCHAFPAFTNLGQQRPGSLFPDRPRRGPYDLLDTPSLLSVSATAPYLSDGRARTLEEVVGGDNRGNHHGDTARLTTAERGDLLRFLEAL